MNAGKAPGFDGVCNHVPKNRWNNCSKIVVDAARSVFHVGHGAD